VAGVLEPGELAEGSRAGGRYTVVAPISHGAMGAVYRARDDETGALVALKHLTDRTQSARFEIEARLLGGLRHPRVVRVSGHFEDENGRFLVMDLVEGIDLGDLLEQRGGRLPVPEAIDFAMQACEALQYVHDQQIVHRDVKPRNLIAGGDGIVLVDFGIAREIGTGEGGTRAIGTPHYIAPEVFVGEGISPRSDVYSLGATLWTMVAGTPPAFGDRTPLADRVSGVTPELEATLRNALELMPEKRIASVTAFARALGTPLARGAGESLALSVAGPAAEGTLLEAIVKAAAGVFEAAAASIALIDRTTGELVYQAAWGAAAREIVGVRLPPGTGLAGSVIARNEGEALPDVRTDPRFAAQIAAGTGYVPHTMLLAPLRRDGAPVGVLTVLDRRDGRAFSSRHLTRAGLFADLAVAALR
jgi:hypothetical protein